MGSKTATIQDEIKQTKPFAFLEQEAVVSLLRTASYVRLQYDHLVQEEGITTQQYNILRILRGAAQALPTMDISERLVDQTPGITRLLDRLEKKHLIARDRCPHDRRQVLCTITDQAIQLLERLEEPINQLDTASLASLSSDEINSLLTLLQSIRENLKIPE
jgi:DNA-binding MarR family transcriptional regulator